MKHLKTEAIMGKASKYKKIRKLASQLPAINTRQVIGERVKGSDIPKDTLVDGKPVVATDDYRQKRLIEVPLNHNSKMKDAYKKYGLQGVSQYVNSVYSFVNMHTLKSLEHDDTSK